MMKKIFYILLLVIFENILFLSSQASEQEEYDFAAHIHQLTNISLIPEKFTKDISGFKIPPFSFPEQNRNHYDDRAEGTLTPIQSLVMHYTVCDLPGTLDIFTKDLPDGRVSATYVISETDQTLNIPGGQVIRVVPDEYRAWHAGVSQWREIKNLNSSSIGIENVNKGFIDNSDRTRTWFDFDPVQIHSLGLLSQAIVKKYHISPSYVVGHADICPDIKTDPGILFPWGKLYYEYGIGAWLTKDEQMLEKIHDLYCPREKLPQGTSLAFLSTYLKEYGYNIEPQGYLDPHFSNVLKVFKGHFSHNQEREKYNDGPNEKDMLWIWALASKYKRDIGR